MQHDLLTGKIVGGLQLQNDRGLVYPLGMGVGVWDRAGGRHAILHGHTRPVVALSASSSGKLIVSAQNSDPGCQVGDEGGQGRGGELFKL